jgi:hypothetical protein
VAISDVLRSHLDGADPCSVTEMPLGEDLALRRPGDALRALAVDAGREAPVRTLLAQLMGMHTQERAWRLGASGEVLVAAQLDKLIRHDPRWRCLHSVPVGQNNADIDHLVIGPGGVFTLNAKNHPSARIWVAGDTFMVNGQRAPYVRNSRHEAVRASRLLTAACGFPVRASGVVVPVNAGDLTIERPPADVVVVNRRRLGGWLGCRPQILDVYVVDAIFERARRSVTWVGR